jgi:two-component system, LuxR family, sensor kinase FixL
MSAGPISILLVEDSPSDAALLQESLNALGPGQFHVTHVETLAEGLAQLGQGRFDVLLLDLSLPDSMGQQTFMRARAAAPDVPIVVLTGAASDAVGLEAVRQGIQDYLRKGQADVEQTVRAIRYAIERQRAETELRRARDELELRVAERTADLARRAEELHAEIAHRRQAEQAMRESEERYRTLFEAAPVGIAVSNYQGKIIACNRSLCALAGVTPEEARALDASAFHALPGQRRKLLAQVRKQGRVDQCEGLLRRKDGSALLVLLHLEEVRVGSRKLLLTIVQDITAQKQNEWHTEGVRELLELFATKTSRSAYVNSVVRFLKQWSGCRCAGVRLTSHDGCIPYAAWTGYSPGFLKQENCLSLETADCPCSRIFGGRALSSDKQFTSRKGSFFCNQASQVAAAFCSEPVRQTQVPCLRAGYDSLAHAPIRYHNRLLGTIHLADPRPDRLPTETVNFIESVAPLIGEALHRFEVEESLVESERRFRSMFERHGAAMLLVDPAAGLIEDANPAAAAFYGFSRECLRKMKLGDLCGVAPQKSLRLCGRARLAGHGDPTCPHRLANGEVRTVEVHSSPFEVQGRRLLFLIIHDVTERKRLEKEILDIGESERQRIGQDLHDSLGGMLGGAALLGKALARRLGPKGSTESAVAEEIVRCVNEAIGQTRAISRGLFPAELSAGGLVAGLREFAAETTRRAGITCDLHEGKGVAVRDTSVALHLFRIVQEAVNNAVRHAMARHVSIRLARIGEQILLEVRDDGKGLPSGSPNGCGLGLRTMRYRAGVIGAQFAVESGEQGGTVVSCLLPVRNPLPLKSA